MAEVMVEAPGKWVKVGEKWVEKVEGTVVAEGLGKEGIDATVDIDEKKNTVPEQKVSDPKNYLDGAARENEGSQSNQDGDLTEDKQG